MEWEQQRHETDDEYELFQQYLAMLPHERSLPALARSVGLAYSRILAIATRNSWQSRAAAYDRSILDSVKASVAREWLTAYVGLVEAIRQITARIIEAAGKVAVESPVQLERLARAVSLLAGVVPQFNLEAREHQQVSIQAVVGVLNEIERICPGIIISGAVDSTEFLPQRPAGSGDGGILPPGPDTACAVPAEVTGSCAGAEERAATVGDNRPVSAEENG
ncbi:hypothetical protein [Thermogutta sp.]|jgi:hypothetical protein|uniref:hypothetical protein n=1 Tax=Thermogutta sp. TaxID=1962930 RepID=UPI0032205699